MAIASTESKTPSTQKAILQAKEPVGALQLCDDRPLPKLLPGQVLVKTAAVALNPCDWKMPTNFPCPGAVDGSDFSGTVVGLGPDLARDINVGDRVAGAVHASNPLNPSSGAFADYLAAYADQLWKMPDSMAWEDAAAIGWCVVGTIGLAMIRSLKLPGSPEQPVEKPVYVLVYGGSTASGTMAIQMLRLSGFRVITTCSSKHFGLMTSYGAEKAFDYNSPSCAEEIRSYTKNTLQYVIDIIAEVKTIRLCYAAIGRAGGRYVGFELIPEELVRDMRKTVKPDWVLGITMSGNEIAIGGGYGSQPNPELRIFGCELFRRVEALIHAGKIRPHPIKLQQGGLDAVIAGVERMQRREISGEKLVYRLDRESSSPPTISKPVVKETNGPVKHLANGISLPSTQAALKIAAPGKMKVEEKARAPRTKDDEVLVQVHCVGLNPVDAKSVDLSPSVGATPGCDFAGTVVNIGSAVKKRLSVGDRVCGCVFGNNPDRLDNGAFAVNVAVPGDLVFNVPPSMSLQTAATLGVGVATIGLALYHKLALPLPSPSTPTPGANTNYVLVYGGGTATGLLAIQSLRLSGLSPITTCSQQTASLVKSAGAVEVFDHRSRSCGDAIRRYTHDSLAYVLDCITSVESAKTCYTAFGSKGGQYMGLEAPPAQTKFIRKDIQPDWVIMFTMFNQPIRWQKPFNREAQPEDRRFAEKWFEVAQELLNHGLLAPKGYDEGRGGLVGVIDGVDSVRKGKVASRKLVYVLRG
ncbi:MAG: hypothetical protein Q9214_002883 [Letrouitia sp. 1 TL-2023]